MTTVAMALHTSSGTELSTMWVNLAVNRSALGFNEETNYDFSLEISIKVTFASGTANALTRIRWIWISAIQSGTSLRPASHDTTLE